MGGKLIKNLIVVSLSVIAFYLASKNSISNQEIDYLKYSEILKIKNEYQYFTLLPDIKKSFEDGIITNDEYKLIILKTYEHDQSSPKEKRATSRLIELISQ